MTTGSRTLQTALQAMKISETDYNRELEVVGRSPKELIGHSIKATYDMVGMTPKDFYELHGSAELDLPELKRQFTEFCTDYEACLSQEKPSMAVDFCAKIIYIVGPESRQVKKTDGDKFWKFNFPNSTTESGCVKCVFVSTYKSDKAQYVPTTEAKKLNLTVKQAGLLAMATFDRLVDLSNNLLLTPLAGATFSRNDICKITTELSMYHSRQFQDKEVCKLINSSCQSAGHHLPNSKSSCALVAAVVATRNVKDEKVKYSIISKIGRQYNAKQKTFDTGSFKIYAKYAHGGVPANMTPETLIREYDDVQISLRQVAIASRQTRLLSTIEVPEEPEASNL